MIVTIQILNTHTVFIRYSTGFRFRAKLVKVISYNPIWIALEAVDLSPITLPLVGSVTKLN